ncbi:MAG: putative quinol monooxygenase [Octadecabacter sp.]
MGLVTLTGTLTCRTDADIETVRQYLPDHIQLSRAEPGCIKFDVTQGENPFVWHLDEAFTDADAFAAHQSRTKATIWAEKSADLIRDFKRVDH